MDRTFHDSDIYENTFFSFLTLLLGELFPLGELLGLGQRLLAGDLGLGGGQFDAHDVVHLHHGQFEECVEKNLKETHILSYTPS